MPLSVRDFILIFSDQNKLLEISRCIQEIDKDHNGYITSSEMDDILKLYCTPLEKCDIIPII